MVWPVKNMATRFFQPGMFSLEVASAGATAGESIEDMKANP
jgi:hypothetical protein